MSTREESETERRETLEAYEDYKHRFITSGGDGRRFDRLHLAAAAVRRAERSHDDLGGTGRVRAGRHRTRDPPGAGRPDARGHRGPVGGAVARVPQGLWPYGPPMDI